MYEYIIFNKNLKCLAKEGLYKVVNDIYIPEGVSMDSRSLFKFWMFNQNIEILELHLTNDFRGVKNDMNGIVVV